MPIDRNLLERIRTRGEEVLSQLSAELRSSPGFRKAAEEASRGREKLEQAAARALEQMNVPTRRELDRASARIEALEHEIAALRAKARGGQRQKPRTARTTTGGASGRTTVKAKVRTPARPGPGRRRSGAE